MITSIAQQKLQGLDLKIYEKCLGVDWSYDPQYLINLINILNTCSHRRKRKGLRSKQQYDAVYAVLYSLTRAGKSYLHLEGIKVMDW